jgi:ElaB/YqjD/DUF883 family membrane-anchored ribosome-binding protein
MPKNPSIPDTNTIEGMVESEVAQEMAREDLGFGDLWKEARQGIETYVKTDPWTGLLAAALVGAVTALLLS